MIAKTYFFAKTFHALKPKSLRLVKSLRDHVDGHKSGRRVIRDILGVRGGSSSQEAARAATFSILASPGSAAWRLARADCGCLAPSRGLIVGHTRQRPAAPSGCGGLSHFA